MDFSYFDNIQQCLTSTQEMKILIVDDDPAMAKSIRGILATVGLNAHSVTRGQLAIDELQLNPYDLVLLDLNMPDMDGTEVLYHINAHKIDTSVIVVSGESEINKAVEVLRAGAKDFIRKPYSTDELLFSIKNVCEKKALQLQNREMVEKLEESEALHRFIVHNSPDLLYMLDRCGNFVFVNKNTIKLLGYSRKELIGKHYSDVVYAKDLGKANMFFNNSHFPRNTSSLELRLICKKPDNLLHVEVRALNIEKKIAGGYKLGRHNTLTQNFIGTYGVARDITERKRSEEIIRFQMNHDLLTGLPNRTLLNEHLATLITHAGQHHEKFAVLFIDINRFKLINDTYGQSIGDDFLRSFASTLRRELREGDTLARLGGDEFILLLPDIDSETDAMTVADKIITQASMPYLHNGHEIHYTLSVGIAIFPEHGETREELIKNVDTAVCNAKTKTGSRHCLYNRNLKNQNSQKVFIENLIRDSIKHDRFVVFYQPQIDLPLKKIHAVEALVRIMSPNKKLILPGKFIDIAEETSLINDIGEIVLEKVCHDINRWQGLGLQIRVSINMSAQQLAMEYFADQFLGRLEEHAINPADIELELTENVLVQNMKRTIANIVQLTDAGIKIAIDDFGTGYSSLSYLDRLPLNTLKLDKSFVQKISEENRQDTIIPAMINVSNGLQLDFIAEGVETKIQHEYLLNLGHCIAQGFYYSRPLSYDQLITFVKRHGLS